MKWPSESAVDVLLQHGQPSAAMVLPIWVSSVLRERAVPSWLRISVQETSVDPAQRSLNAPSQPICDIANLVSKIINCVFISQLGQRTRGQKSI